MDNALPLTSVVLFVACGALVAIIVFLFAKRQITRFALKSSRHVPIGTDVPKRLRQEVERRLKRTADIKYEPILLSAATEQTIEDTFQGETCHFLYRMKAVDALKVLDEELQQGGGGPRRQPGENLRLFLLEQRAAPAGPLQHVSLELLERLVDAYEHARHLPHEFKAEHYHEFTDLRDQMIDYIRSRRGGGAEGATAAAAAKDSTSDSTTGATNDADSGIQVAYRPGRGRGEAAALIQTSPAAGGPSTVVLRVGKPTSDESSV